MSQLDEARTVADSSADHAADHNILHRKANRLVSVLDYGAVGDGSTDDSAAIQSAIDAAESNNGTVYFPSSTFKIDSGIVVLDCSVSSAPGARLTVADGVAVGVTIGSSSQSCDRHVLRLPEVYRASLDWDSTPTINTARGVVLKAADSCIVDLPDIRNFSYGLVLEGDGQGVAYNVIYPRAIINNAINIFLNAINSGWANQNTILGGRISLNDIGGSPPYSGTRQLVLGSDTAIDQPNGNVFVGTSLESNSDEYKIECWGNNNTFLGLRFEDSGTPAVIWRDYSASSYANNNIIYGGWDSVQLSVTSEPYSRYNSIVTGSQVEYNFSRSGRGPLALSNRSTDTLGISLFRGDEQIDDKTDSEYQVSIGAAVVALKAEADSYDRIYVNNALGRIYMGTGGSDPTANGFLRYANGAYEFNGAALRVGSSGGVLQSGTGSPEGSVTATVGSLYMRTDGGSSTTLYVKESGSGNTGWAAK